MRENLLKTLEAIAKPRSRQARPSHNRVNLAFFGRDALVASANCRGFCNCLFGLKDQIQRAAVSVCSNITEGYARRGNKELIKFLWIARGSTAEVCSQLYHAKYLGYVNESIHKELYELAGP